MDASPVFEASEEIFDPVSLSVEDGIVREAAFVVAMGRDAGGDAACVEGLAEPVAVVGPIGEQDSRVGQARCQGPGPDVVVALSFGEEEAQGAAPAIAQDVQLAGQAASAPSDSAG